ncbi:MAG: tetratricopeptide repeat protein, partial [Planctomycetota bacterium]
MAIKPTKQQIMQRTMRADEYARKGDLTNAAMTLYPVIEHAKDMHNVVLFWAGIRARQGHYGEAADWYRHLLKTHHDNIQVRQSLALCLRRDGQYDEAIRQIERIRETDEWNVMAVLTLVDTHATLNDHDSAIALLDELEANVPEEQTDAEQRARMKIIRLRLRNEADRAAPALADAENTELRPDTRSSLAQHAGIALQKDGKHAEAWDAMAKAKQYRGLRFDADEHDGAGGTAPQESPPAEIEDYEFS